MHALKWLLTVALFSLTIVNAAQAPEAYFMVEVSNDTPYTGENITYAWTLYYAGDAPLNDAVFLTPDFNGFGQQHLTPPSATNEFQDGRLYTVTRGQVILTPLRAGAHSIEPYRVLVPETPFSDEQSIESDSIDLTVRQLPQPVPAQYSGGIGTFSYNVQTMFATEEVETGTPITITATITGTGSLQNITLPEPAFDPDMLQLVNSATSYEPAGMASGQHQTQWTFIPQRAGSTSITVPPLITFDPQDDTYHTNTVSPVTLIITGDQMIEPAPDRIRVQPGSLLPLDSRGVSWQPDRAYWLLWFVPAGFVLLATIYAQGQRMRRPTLPSRTGRRHNPNARNAIQRIKGQRNNPPVDAFDDIAAILEAYLRKRFRLSPETNLMAEQFINEEITRQVHRTLTSARHGKYAPVAAVDVQRLVRDAVTLIQRIEAAS